MSEFQKDYADLLELFNTHKVRYCIVGAYAVAFYALPRYTKDIDIFVEADIQNGEKITKALEEFGFKGMDLSSADFAHTGKTVQLGFEPVRIDILTAIDGCKFEQVWKNRKKGRYGEVPVNFIGLKELIKNKKATGRTQDKADLEVLIVRPKSKR